MTGLVYSVEELSKKTAEIDASTGTFRGQLESLASTAEDLRANYSSEDAMKIKTSIDKVRENGEEFNEAIKAFIRHINDEVIPTYQKIEANASEKISADSYYG